MRACLQAAEINLVGCQFGPKDAALWKKTGQMFLELGRPFFLKAQYCFGRAIKVCVRGGFSSQLHEHHVLYDMI